VSGECINCGCRTGRPDKPALRAGWRANEHSREMHDKLCKYHGFAMQWRPLENGAGRRPRRTGADLRRSSGGRVAKPASRLGPALASLGGGRTFWKRAKLSGRGSLRPGKSSLPHCVQDRSRRPVKWQENLLRIVQEATRNALHTAERSRLTFVYPMESGRMRLPTLRGRRGFDLEKLR